jgi:MFS family permease
VINVVATQPWMPSVSFFAVSFAIVCFNVPAQSLRQIITPEPILGRVVATFRMVGMGAAPLGALLGGFITQAADVRVANGVASSFQFVAWIILIATLRHANRSELTVPTASPQEVADHVAPQARGQRE